MIGIVFSVNDPAGTGAARKLLRLGFVKHSCDAVECWVSENAILAGFQEDVINFDFLEARLPDVEYYIVLSRHSSQAGVKSYTVHHTGNYSNEALYGGKPGELGVANPVVAFTLLRELARNAEETGRIKDYRVSYEATHHGPTSLAKPLTFIEIGSSLSEWVDETNHEIIARSVEWLLRNNTAKCTPAIGIGGGHYPWKLTEYSLRENVCFGHIMPKYALEHLSEEVLKQMIERSADKIKLVVVEKKSTNQAHRSMIEGFARKYYLGLVYI
ncbi:D-aminoacyl-tRNA deacylase [Thermogladius sp. 4427co]|uniref:D-aminoacyl-tRNA deacylase n=1 Tax=Thermogladius sp. 4427co TaxID=3450718 RepID=UPI003F7AA7F2